MTCKTHPDAPHGFVRGASHSEDRYVCECEFWEEPKMNERIEKLSKEAQLYALDAMIKITDKEQALKVYSETYNTTFAELIVKECGDVAYNAYWENPETVRGIHIKEKIKQHFGVEE